MNGRVFDLGEYPGAVFDPLATSRVQGRVFEMPSDAQFLAQLDRYEEYSPEKNGESLFVRKKCPVMLDTGVEMRCWVDLYNQDLRDATVISSGDYASWIADREHGISRGRESLAEADPRG